MEVQKMPAIKYQKFPMSDKTWDASKNEKNLKSGQDRAYYEKCYAWRDPDADDTTKAAYKFIHNEVDSDGNIGDANIKACQSGIGVLNGAMGGADIPDADRKGIYNHLAKHLKDADIEPAELKSRSKILSSHEVRAFSMPDLKANDEGSTVEGHAAVYGQTTDIGPFEETIARGAFDKTDFTDVLFSVNHDLSRIPLARSRNNNANSTLQLSVDEVGLAMRAKIDLDNNPQAKALYSAIKRGDINGMSFIFEIADDEWVGMDTDHPHRTINAINKVYEVSAVSFPAYDGTDINARSQKVLDSAKNALVSARAKAGEPENERSQNNDNIELERLKYELLLNL
jgi:hypothetical protein